MIGMSLGICGFAWAFEGVYGPNIRCLLWKELAGLISWWDVPWYVGGDFNVTHFPSERAGECVSNPAMTDFSDFISKQGLMDLPLARGTFTWSNSFSRFRIDRFLVSPEWEVKYPGLSQNNCLDCVWIIFPFCLIAMV
jgi:hypothetical protein